MAKSNSKKRPARVTFSRKVEDGYENVSNAQEATGIHVHRNDDTAKSFKATVDKVASKLKGSGFRIEEQKADYALFIKPNSQSVDEFLDSMDEVPF